MKFNTPFKASGTFIAEQEITHTCNSTVRFQFHLCFLRNSLVHKKPKIRKERICRFTVLVQFLPLLTHVNVLPVHIILNR